MVSVRSFSLNSLPSFGAQSRQAGKYLRPVRSADDIDLIPTPKEHKSKEPPTPVGRNRSFNTVPSLLMAFDLVRNKHASMLSLQNSNQSRSFSIKKSSLELPLDGISPERIRLSNINRKRMVGYHSTTPEAAERIVTEGFTGNRVFLLPKENFHYGKFCLKVYATDDIDIHKFPQENYKDLPTCVGHERYEVFVSDVRKLIAEIHAVSPEKNVPRCDEACWKPDSRFD